ncbi:hypothetical protein DMC30DRAFT_445769 [Rhodotorula diobovata]|uniref:Proteophosphoglycan ppg4 n=1 Tax=Rhodotorula diobovata TaxID=5288 RepID=A0A5C5FYH1_9BASI|nr:hypothetical protein DMC30DRAFT_445769 [Rhodotorula diobovata]
MQLTALNLVSLLALAATLCTSRSSPSRLDSPAAPLQPGMQATGLVHESDAVAAPFHPVERSAAKKDASTESSPDDELASAAQTLPSTKSKRCVYIGTFFHVIDCNAPVNLTQVPNAPPAESEQVTTPSLRSSQVAVVSTGLVTRIKSKAEATTQTVRGG